MNRAKEAKDIEPWGGVEDAAGWDSNRGRGNISIAGCGGWARRMLVLTLKFSQPAPQTQATFS